MYPCLYCTRSYANQSTVIDHCKRDHDLVGVEDVYGHVCPLCGTSFARLGGHAGHAHHLAISLLFAQAEKQGDPHGVVAARLTRYHEHHKRMVDRRTREHHQAVLDRVQALYRRS